MSILHKSTDPTLLTRLQQMLGSSKQADIAVGYFFISGFGQIASELTSVEKVRILVGRTDQQVLEEVAAGLNQSGALRAKLEADSLVRKSEKEVIARQSVAHIAEGAAQLAQSDETQQAVTQLRDLVREGRVEVRAYVKSPLHAKAYLCWYEDGHPEHGAAVVGSSNLTLAGFSGNTELNVRVTGDDEMRVLKDWFEELWAESVDIGGELETELERSWAIEQTSPYLVYLKALHELFHRGTDRELPAPTKELANFQIDAVRRGLEMIDRHGGCYIGDVVGLGKTYIGAELLRQLSFSYPHDGKPLILCPAGLIPMWRHFNETFGLGAEVVSHNMIAPSGAPEFDEELGRYVDADPPGRGKVLQEKYANRGPVLVDEAHNFRNHNQRSAGLREYLNAGDHKVILMSATPQNLGPMDIYRQLTLFLDENDHGLPIEPVNLEAYFRNAVAWAEYQTESKRHDADYIEWNKNRNRSEMPKAPKKPSVPQRDITEALSPVFVRRRRIDIRELYGDDAQINGEPIRFPEPKLENISYQLDRVYQRAGTFDELTDLLKGHKASRYNASAYLLDTARTQERYEGLLRSRDRVTGLMQALLLKRLESSVEAFRSTLESLMRSNRHFREALEDGFVPVGPLATRLINGQQFDADEAFEILSQEDDQRRGAAHPVDDFRVDAWIRDLDADHGFLTDLHERVRKVKSEDDDKLRALREFLERPEVASGKVLIFSEAETTIDYLYRELNSGENDPTIARLTGSNRDHAERIVGRFSPRSNQRPASRDGQPEIRILLATDVVSEGQNLQDCARVLNYDLHWNPVRLIQRFGRVDRIGTEFEVIHLQSMWPDLAVDAHLELTKQLEGRIQLFHDVIGLDNQLLSKSEQVNFDDMWEMYGAQQLPEFDDGLDEVSIHQRAVATLQRIREDQPDLWTKIENLPDGIRSALTVRTVAREAEPAAGTQPSLPLGLSAFSDPAPGETLVLLGAGELKSCYAVGDNLDVRPISAAQFVAHAECEPHTPRASLPDNTNERVMAAFDRFSTEVGEMLGRDKPPPTTKARRYVIKQLNLLRNQADGDTDATKRIDRLRRIFSAPLPNQAESAIDEVMAVQPQSNALLVRLEAICEQYRLTVPSEAEPRERPQPEIIRIVCSDGLAAG